MNSTLETARFKKVTSSGLRFVFVFCFFRLRMLKCRAVRLVFDVIFFQKTNLGLHIFKFWFKILAFVSSALMYLLRFNLLTICLAIFYLSIWFVFCHQANPKVWTNSNHNKLNNFIQYLVCTSTVTSSLSYFLFDWEIGRQLNITIVFILEKDFW